MPFNGVLTENSSHPKSGGFRHVPMAKSTDLRQRGGRRQERLGAGPGWPRAAALAQAGKRKPARQEELNNIAAVAFARSKVLNVLIRSWVATEGSPRAKVPAVRARSTAASGDPHSDFDGAAAQPTALRSWEAPRGDRATG